MRSAGIPPVSRLLWTHPFLDGNGRVARLMSHALFKRLGIGTSLWSVARGLARDEAHYKALLAQADAPREGDRDGRGNLTQRGLIEFCQFFLDQSVDQIRVMSGLLKPATLLTRMEILVEEEYARSACRAAVSPCCGKWWWPARWSGPKFRRSPAMRSAARGT